MEAINILEEANDRKERRSIALKQKLGKKEEPKQKKKASPSKEGCSDDFFSNFFSVFKCGNN